MLLDEATLEQMRKRYRPKAGDRVRTKYKFYGRNRRGEITSINGAYINVRLNYKGITIEAYPNELEKL